MTKTYLMDVALNYYIFCFANSNEKKEPYIETICFSFLKNIEFYFIHIIFLINL